MTSHEMEKGKQYPLNTIHPAPDPSNEAASTTHPTNQSALHNGAPPPNYYSGHPQHQVIVTTQPGVIILPQPVHKDYLAWSIISLIFCNCIIGIVALVFSDKTRDASRRGDAAMAASYSKTTRVLNIAALVLGISCHCIWIIFVIYNLVSASRVVSNYSYTYYG